MRPVFRSALLLLTSTLVAASGWALDAPAPADFAWRATLTPPAGASVARVSLPPEALLQLQSSDARDVRVFNAEGEAVAFAFTAPAGATPDPVWVNTRAYPAHPLFAAARGQRPAKGALEVQLDQNGSQSSVWVRLTDKADATGTAPASVMPLQSALFDTRTEKQPLTALSLQAELPANALIHFTVATSPDLAHWTRVAVSGPLFRFDGAGAPASQTLELLQPLRLEDRYLRLGWEGQGDVRLSSVTGRVAPAMQPPARVRAALPAGVADGSTGMNWPIGFATPIAALHLTVSRNNTLIPVRILGRNDAAQAWRLLAQSVVYRVGEPGQEKSNPPVALGGASLRWLRVEATNGMALPGPDLQATAEFTPVELVFLATGQAPFELAVGRSSTPAAAVQPSLISSVVTGKLADLPVASLSNMRLAKSTPVDAALQRWLPAGLEQRSVMLWAVLLLGVGVLAAVAYGLYRQLSAKSASA